MSQGSTHLRYLCLHGHFYQPPREDPFTSVLPIEEGATPFSNYNEKITAECYEPNAKAGNFAGISYDLGPTLATWLADTYPDIYRKIIQADRDHLTEHGVGNALAQAYNHTILPLANSRDKQTQILWGLRDFQQRYGRDARGMWLPETAVDLESLDLLAQNGITYTILAPWQAATPIDPTEPYLVNLPSGRKITVFFYNQHLSGGISFDEGMTADANVFATQTLPEQLSKEKEEQGQAQLILIASDGEVYGHHKKWRDKFLSYLVQNSAEVAGFEVITLERYLQLYPPGKEVTLKVPSSWSCEHGIARWSTGCTCTEGSSAWKPDLRKALVNLSDQGDKVFAQYGQRLLRDPWAARNQYLAIRNDWDDHERFWNHHTRPLRKLSWLQKRQVSLLLEAQYYQQYSFTSCAFFFEDLDRIEPHNAIAFGRRAISLIWQATGVDLESSFLEDLEKVHSGRQDLSGAQIYRSLPLLPPELLPEKK